MSGQGRCVGAPCPKEWCFSITSWVNFLKDDDGYTILVLECEKCGTAWIDNGSVTRTAEIADQATELRKLKWWERLWSRLTS